MKVQNKPSSLLVAIFMAMTYHAHGANYTWDGGGGDGLWKTGSNWVGNAAPPGAQVLFFAGTNHLTAENDNINYSVYGITFNADAGGFTLTGNTVRTHGPIVNNSTSTQTLSLEIGLESSPTSFNAIKGDIVSTVGISGVDKTLAKRGLGALTLQGNNTYSGITQLYGGELFLDLSNAGTFSSSNIYFGAPGGVAEANTATLRIKGTTPSLGAVLFNYSNAAAKVTIEADTHATFTSITPASIGSTHFDLSKTGARVSLGTTPTLTGSILRAITVKDGTKTGFATVVGGELQRFTSFTGALPTASAVYTGNNYTLSGDSINGSLWANFNSLTITGGGTFTTTHNSGLLMNALLMEEGVGNYTFNGRVRSSQALYIHQYSTSGTLTLNKEIHDANHGYSFTKAGPGAVHVAASSTSSYTQGTYLQGGLFQLDGALTKTNAVIVYAGAQLSGSGAIGSEGFNSAVSIREGATLIASSSSALDITGSLTFDERSSFAFTLGSGSDKVSVSQSATLNGADLLLTLAAAPAPEDFFTILSAATVSGQFGSINGSAFEMDDKFSLRFEGIDYQFRLSYNSESIVVHAIPEPSAVALLGMGAAAGLASYRRRRG